jgi:phosphoribosylglycinamide formyltransferase-1
MSIAIFASGNGSNFQSIVEHAQQEEWPQSIALLICDQPNAKVLKRAEKLGIPYQVVDPKQFSSKATYEQAILSHLHQYRIEWIVLAGYMRLIGPTLLKVYEGRIVNIHPSLLPAFPGLHAIEKAFFYPVKISGVTIHFVDEGMDTGPIIAQEAVTIEEQDTLESFRSKIQQVEHRLYPKVILQLIQGKIPFKRRSDE